MSPEGISTFAPRRSLRPGSAAALGATYAGAPRPPAWPHAFMPSLTAGGVRFSLGLLNQKYEPTIGGDPISSGAVLALDSSVVNADGVSWAAIEFEPTEAGSIDDKTSIEVVHTAAGLSGDPKLARHHLAMILWTPDGQPFRALEITMFNLRYHRVTRADERPAFHWFG